MMWKNSNFIALMIFSKKYYNVTCNKIKMDKSYFIQHQSEVYFFFLYYSYF